MRRFTPAVRSRQVPLILSAVISLALPLQACGGDDGFEDIEQTATAVASMQPTATPTPDPVAAYRIAIQEGIPVLRERVAQLWTDLLAAQENQADPKWPGVLHADLDLVQSSADELRLESPGEPYDGFQQQLTALLDEMTGGVESLSAAIDSADATLAAEGVAAITGSDAQIGELLETFPAE